MKPIDLGNARLRGMVERLDEEKAWQLLWLPPSLPYYGAGRPFDQATIATKRLVFSAWTVVPKAIAALTSYEAERRPVQQAAGPQAAGRAGAAVARPAARWTELVLSLPSASLARLGDPRAIAAEMGGGDGPVDPHEVIRRAEENVRKALKPFSQKKASRPRDLRWYAVAPLLLDETHETGAVRAWLEAAEAGTHDAAAWRAHRWRLLDLVENPSQLGRMPEDLAAVLAKAAIAGPGNAALRALTHLPDVGNAELLRRAFAIGFAFRRCSTPRGLRHRSLPSPRRVSPTTCFWKAALDYCVAGNLQAVFDEYVHVLGDWVEDRPRERGGKVAAVVDTAVEAIGIHTADLTARTIEDGRVGEPLRCAAGSRCDWETVDGGRQVRTNASTTVRKAFYYIRRSGRSCSRRHRIGQEGLDFHLYGHSVVHWNLPSNPVDLEQREGRVHRFKGHAVRRNLASRYRADGVAAAGDPWTAMFDAAPREDEGLQPCWLFDGEARIERHALVLPMSRDAHRLKELVRLLGIYPPRVRTTAARRATRRPAPDPEHRAPRRRARDRPAATRRGGSAQLTRHRLFAQGHSIAGRFDR